MRVTLTKDELTKCKFFLSNVQKISRLLSSGRKQQKLVTSKR